MADQEGPPEAQLPAQVQGLADEIGHLHRRGGVEAQGLPDKIAAVVAGGQEHIVLALRPPLAQLHSDGVH